MAERTWPENCWPTAEQWLPWFLDLDPEQQLELAERILRDAEGVHRCLVENHEGLKRDLSHLRSTFRDLQGAFGANYRQGWDDALVAVQKIWAESDALVAAREALRGERA